ncbi:tetratricopeptide repeat protein [Pseudoteredinibacter isoporae]|uniref:tetratricopeptide repeat protein n=1 Tax=Pseudoteredinibacter isoporae TaxID=570281 RepID=UPI0031029C94
MNNIRDFFSAAEKGNANAQKDLAAMLASGSLGQVDNESAAYWYSKAAEQGLVDAKWNLGLMYVNGEGVEKSERFGLELIEKSATEGS